MLRYELRSGRSTIDNVGVFAAEKVPSRRKIGEVTGEVISVRTARRRAREACRMCLVDLTDTHALDCSKGNVLRFLNHSCRSNAYLRIIRNRVEVYSRRAIRNGEEITVDDGESAHPGGMPCRCGGTDCRDRI